MVFVLSFLIMALIMAGMALGAMAGRGPLKGSCGGLSAVGIEGRCEICGDDPSRCEEQTQARSLDHPEHDSRPAPRQTDTLYYDASK